MSPNPTQGNEAALGVDGGSGTLRFALRAGDGSIHHHECAGASPTLLGMDVFVERLEQGINAALASADLKAEQVASAGFGLSGVDRDHEILHLKGILRTRTLPNCTRLWVGNDAMAALRQGAGRMRGLVLIAGTGSICFAIAADGRHARVGGWGGELGDEGSGFWVGQRALRLVCRMVDGRLKRTALVDKVVAHLGLEQPHDLIPWSSFKSRQEFKNQTASLVPIVAEQAELGDEAAQETISLGIGFLIQHVIAAQNILARFEKDSQFEEGSREQSEALGGGIATGGPSDETPSSSQLDLVCAGGLFAGSEQFYQSFVQELRGRSGTLNPVRLTESASLGALALGEEMGED